MESEIYQVKIDNFEGPFGLLLNLVEERKLFINEISLAQVTEDYLSYLKKFEKTHPGELSHFIIIAATLILIKSKSLLPGLNLSNEEESDIKSLEERLKLFEIYSLLAGKIKEKFGQRMIFFSKERKNEILMFLPDERITPENMLQNVLDVLNKIPKKIFLPKVEVKKVISLEEMINRLTQRIQNSLEINFKEFSGQTKTKEEKVIAIVGFLAMLELVRQGMLEVIQDNNFEDIIIKKTIYE